MNPQDIAIAVLTVLVVGTLVWGTSGPRHRGVHNLLLAVAVLCPLVSFDLTQSSAIPPEVWVFSGAYFLGQASNAAFHYIWPKAVHARSGEAIMQVTFAIWAMGIRVGLEPSLWYRGTVGTVLFCVSTIWVTLVVLCSIYQGELTSHARDDFDFFKLPLRSRGNAAILTCSPPTLLLALYVALQNPWLIAGALGSWVTLRAVLRPAEAK